MVEIQPFKYQKSTNIEEHNQMKGKINEMVEVINNVDLENLPSQINALETEVATQGNEIDALQVAVDAIPGTYAKKTDIPDVSDFITADALTPYAKTVDVDNADVTGVDATINNGEITIKLTRPDGDMSDSIDCPFIQTATLIPTSTARAFKIRFTYTDGTQYDTNEFVIPEGGGTDVSVTGVTVGNGTAPNSFKVSIQLSDTTTIGSNDYTIEFPENVNTYPTTLTATLSGTTLNMTIGLNDSSTVKGTADLSGLLTNYATESYVDTQVATKLDKTTADGYYQPKGNYVTAPAITSVEGEVNNGILVIKVNGVSSGDIPLPESKIVLLNPVPVPKGGNNFSSRNGIRFKIKSTNADDTINCISPVDCGFKFNGGINELEIVNNINLRNTIPVDKAFFESMGFKNMPDGRYNINLTTIEEYTAKNTNYVATLYESTIAVSVSEGEITYYTPYIEVSYTNSLNVGDLVYPIVVTILS